VHAQTGLKPFTAERWIYSDGNLIGKEITAFDQAGAKAVSSTPLSDPSRFILRTVERPDGFTAKILDSANLISSGYVADVSQLNGCAASKGSNVIGQEQLLGVDVMIVQTVGPASVRTTQALAPALGCFALSHRSERKSPDGSWIVRTEYKTVRLDMEASAELFIIPVGYTEVKPSEINRKVSSLLGRQLPPSSSDSDFDAEYLKMSRMPIH